MKTALKKYYVMGEAGSRFWKGTPYFLGQFRFLWLARLRAWWHVRVENPYRIATIYIRFK